VRLRLLVEFRREVKNWRAWEGAATRGRPLNFESSSRGHVQKARVQNPRKIPESRPTASKTRCSGDQFREWKAVRPTASTGFLERAMGIEPTPDAWARELKGVILQP
jgi:hypothetical protein